MEYKLSKTTLSRPECVFSTVSEQAVDVDITLPDYCPDIERILRCSLTPCVYSKNLSGGQLSVDGGAVLRILYVDSSKNCIRSFEHTVPWSETFSVKDVSQQYVICVRCKPEYINCRAMSPRKLSLHGAFSLYAKVICKQPADFYTESEEDDLQILRKGITVSSLCSLCEEQFSHSEDIPLGDKPPVESILQSGITLKITELRCTDSKLMLSAQGELRMMYLCDLEKGRMEHLSYVFPISRIIDCDGLTDDAVADVDLFVQSFDITVSRDALSDEELLRLDLKLCARVMGYREEQMDVICDAYSVSNPVELTKTPVTVSSDVSSDTLGHIQKTTVGIENESISEVLDISLISASASPMMQDDVLSIDTKLKIGLLMKNTDGEPLYIERNIDFAFIPEKAIKETVESVCVSVDSISFRIVDEKHIELRIDLSYRIVSSNCVRISQVCAAESVEGAERPVDDSALILYYADKGESFWDISKEHATKVSDLKSENALEGDTVQEKMMLLIPTA